MPARQGLGQFPFEYDFHIREIPKQYATIILKRDEGGKYFKSSVRFGACKIKTGYIVIYRDGARVLS